MTQCFHHSPVTELTITVCKCNHSQDSQECHRCQKYYWSTELRDGCVPMPEEFLDFYDPLAMALLMTALLGIMAAMVVVLLAFLNHESYVVKTTNGFLAGALIIGVISSFASSVSFPGQPTNVSCHIREPMTCFLLSVSLTSVLAMSASLIISSKGNIINMQ